MNGMNLDVALLCPMCKERDLKVELSFSCRHRFCIPCLMNMYNHSTGELKCELCDKEQDEDHLKCPIEVSALSLPSSPPRHSPTQGLAHVDQPPQYSAPTVFLHCTRTTDQPHDYWWLHMTVHQDTNDIYVSDRENNKIHVLNCLGQPVRSFGRCGTGNAEFRQPRDLAINRLNQLLVADSGNHRIQVLTLEGDFIYQIGSEGTGDNNFFNISGVTVLGNLLFATDYMRIKVLEMDESNHYQFKSSKDVARNTFGALSGISMNSNGIWVSDWHAGNIYRLTPDGEFIGNLENTGVIWPRGCTTDKELLHVGDKNGRRIFMYGKSRSIVGSIPLDGIPGSVCFLNDRETLVYTVMDGRNGHVHMRKRIKPAPFTIGAD